MKNYRDEIIGDVTLCRSRRARRITVSVRPDGSVRLTYPWFGTQRDALAFLTQRREWVERVRAKLPPERLVPRDEATRRARIEALRHEAKEVLPERVATIADRLGMTLGLRCIGFSPMFSLLMPTFSLLLRPSVLSI